jgi:nitrogen fixation NifU-like protein
MSDLYRELIIDHYKHPRNFGTIPDADLSGSEDNVVCGDTVTFFINMKDGKVQNIKWNGSGCALSQASASLLSDMIKGKTEDELRALGEDDILKVVGENLNPSRKKCAILSLEALKKILKK